MLTKDDTTADELGVTDADVAEWEARLARLLANPQTARPVKEVMDELQEEIRRRRAERAK
jgi:hypothetical protein